MFCRKCGTQLKDGAKFCSKCGEPVVVIKQTVKEPVEEVAEEIIEEVVEEPAEESDDEADVVISDEFAELEKEPVREESSDDEEDEGGETVFLFGNNDSDNSENTVRLYDEEFDSDDEENDSDIVIVTKKPENKKVKSEKVKKESSGVVGRVFLCILLGIFLLIMNVSILCRSLLSEKTIEIVLKDNYSTIAELTEQFDFDLSYDSLDKDDKKLADKLIFSTCHDAINWALAGKSNPIDIDNFLDYYQAELEKKAKKEGIDIRDDYFESRLEYELDEMEDRLEDVNDTILDAVGDDFEENLSVVHFIFSVVFMIICIAVNALFILLIMVIYKRKSFKAIGITGIVIGSITAICGLTVSFLEGTITTLIKSSISEDLEIKTKAIRSVVEGLSTALQTSIYMCAGIMAGVGFVLLILGILLNLGKKKK